ncbi:hypothetical protein, partial [Kingella kingae]|uniref:hypothetical protein n=1 Tax=Kingella kingae TaxID=504 RepID=UPI001E4EBD9F
AFAKSFSMSCIILSQAVSIALASNLQLLVLADHSGNSYSIFAIFRYCVALNAQAIIIRYATVLFR